MLPNELERIIKDAAQDGIITSAEYQSIISRAKSIGADLKEVEKAIRESGLCTMYLSPALREIQEHLHWMKMQKDQAVSSISDYTEEDKYKKNYKEVLISYIEDLSYPNDEKELREFYLFCLDRSISQDYNDLEKFSTNNDVQNTWEKKTIGSLKSLLELLKDNQESSEEIVKAALQYNVKICNKVPRALEIIEILKAKAEEEYKATRPSLFQGWRFKLILAGVVLALLQIIFSWHVSLKTLLWITLIVTPITTWYLEAMRIRDMVYDKYHLKEEANASN